jgi:hypothetical protein
VILDINMLRTVVEDWIFGESYTPLTVYIDHHAARARHQSADIMRLEVLHFPVHGVPPAFSIGSSHCLAHAVDPGSWDSCMPRGRRAENAMGASCASSSKMSMAPPRTRSVARKTRSCRSRWEVVHVLHNVPRSRRSVSTPIRAGIVIFDVFDGLVGVV